jgi:RNA polymerase sigma-70 factor (ECF subfamily)
VTPLPEITDEALMARLRDDDREALGTLVERYQQDIFRFCAHYLRDTERAKEIAQETFIRVYVARSRFDVTRAFRPWMLCIARNLCLNDIKRKKTVNMESLEEYASDSREISGMVAQAEPGGPLEQMVAEDRRTALARILEGLDDESRELIRLRFYEELPARDIAAVLGSSEGAIRTRLHRVLKRLRELNQDERDDL